MHANYWTFLKPRPRKDLVRIGFAFFMVMLISFIWLVNANSQTLESPVIIEQGKSVFVKWNRPVETDIELYTIYIVQVDDITKTYMQQIPHWENGEYYNSSFNVNVTSGKVHRMTLTATDYSKNESEPSDPVYFTVKDTISPSKIMGVEIYFQ